MSERDDSIVRLRTELFDVLIVGGGINGATSAAALSAQGLTVALIDKGDFASGTSSQTSNLAWGGIKYLESLEVGLVRSLCKSRNRLMDEYPSSVREMRFLTSVQKGFRYPAVFVYLGALFYWALGGFRTKAAHYIRSSKLGGIEPAIDHQRVSAAFEYSDAHFRDNDARFVFNFIRSGLDRGAAIANYVESVGATRESNGWKVNCIDRVNGNTLNIEAKVLINACGPWTDHHNALSNQLTKHRHILSKGVHLIVNQITPHDRILTFFASDGRPFFVIPMGQKTCIGTTDTPTVDADVAVTAEDREFILNNVNSVLALEKPLTVEDIISERCGVRPLAVNSSSKTSDWMQLSRKHAIDVDQGRQHISIFGGKFTDCLNVGEEIQDIVSSLGIDGKHPTERWYGEADEETRRAFFQRARKTNLDNLTSPDSSETLSARFWRRYGPGANELLDLLADDPTQASIVIPGADVVLCELQYAKRHEMVTNLDDFLRRRTGIALVVPSKTLLSKDVSDRVNDALFGSGVTAQHSSDTAYNDAP